MKIKKTLEEIKTLWAERVAIARIIDKPYILEYAPDLTEEEKKELHLFGLFELNCVVIFDNSNGVALYPAGMC